jgi:uncharacterized protein (DUF4415 family)
MNKVAAFLTVSLAANVALAALFYTRHASANPVGATPPAPAQASVTATRAKTAGAALQVSAGVSHNPDDIAYVARLRAGGMPSEVIHDLVSARVHERYRDRARALQPALGKSEYWRSPLYGPRPATPEQRALLRELYREQEAEVRALLGDGPDSLNSYQKMLRERMADYLSNDKIQQVEAIRKDYDELIARVREQSKGLVLKADREQLRLLERERRADLAATLTPAELLEYDLRASPTSNSVRNRLNFFQPTEEEFRAITRLQLAIDQQFGTSNLSRDEQDRKRAAEKDLAANIQTLLTPERWAEYQVTIDGMFSETLNFVGAYNLDRSVAKEIVAVKQSAWKQIDALDGLGADQRRATLKAIEDQVNKELSTRLGQEVFEKYQRSGAGWLNRLRPTPPPKS